MFRVRRLPPPGTLEKLKVRELKVRELKVHELKVQELLKVRELTVRELKVRRVCLVNKETWFVQFFAAARREC